jgi:hypothetical protein
MNDFVARARVVLTALPTYLTILVAVLTILSDEIATAFPEGSQGVVQVIVVIIAIATSAINIIRRVTPVLPERRGIL